MPGSPGGGLADPAPGNAPGAAPPVRIRIGRLVLQGVPHGDAAAMEAALRGELARLAASAVPARGPAPVAPAGGTLRAATPAGRGREAAARILAALRRPA
ncbi:hypothetical protein [Roseomonas populi]|uniref:Uncharacterized protein n=1 Tax=Roseomonas populi TaxID=3121582 RepID=A0ABT1X3T3_9PROT|nr:hypothetical protein [Roseomonas pecuniae]MCR0982753.1 hypothetical protein [Roseomonas pecuniae]